MLVAEFTRLATGVPAALSHLLGGGTGRRLRTPEEQGLTDGEARRCRGESDSGYALLQLLGQQLIHNLRAGLTLGRFHHLTHEKPEYGLLAGAILLHLL